MNDADVSDNEHEAVRQMVRRHLAAEVTDVHRLSGGEFSRAYAVTVAEQAYVVRLNAHDHAPEAFAKDAYAAHHFASPALPIPRVVAIGDVGPYHAAISERAAGGRMAELSRARQATLLPALLDTCAAIARVDVSTTSGYGYWDVAGQGSSPDWPTFLAAVIENQVDGFYKDWHALFRDSFLERDVYEHIYQHLMRLVDACPSERALLHVDLHDDNILSDGERITGIVDWANAAYGDPLYDVAWLGAWFAVEGRPEAARALYDRHRQAPQFAERLACYLCHLGLDDLRFYARTGRRAGYERTRARLLRLVDTGQIDGTW